MRPEEEALQELRGMSKRLREMEEATVTRVAGALALALLGGFMSGLSVGVGWQHLPAWSVGAGGAFVGALLARFVKPFGPAGP